MTPLPEVTVVAITDKEHGKTIAAIRKTLEHIKPAKVLLFTDVIYTDDAWQNIVIERLGSLNAYSDFVFKRLGDYIKTSHVLIIQHDGYVLDGDVWDPDFLNYDYIGAPWTYRDGRNVGNGGFSLRSARLHKILQDDEYELCHPEDEKICRYYRQHLERKHDIKFAPDDVAHRFSFETQKPSSKTFGFHSYFHEPYREPIVLRRTGAMGDVIMMEPVMEELYKQGYRVILDTQPQYYNLFQKHSYPIELLRNVYAQEDVSNFRIINLDMTYEVEPKQLASMAYAKACGVEMTPRNSKLAFTGTQPLFDRYILLHTDDTSMPHRNIHGVSWSLIADELTKMGWLVLRVGNDNGVGGIKVNTHNEGMLAWIIAGARYFIGIDSGCAQIAVACGVKSIIFFGSVNPAYRYVLNENIIPIQNACPIGKDGCYHDSISVVGKDCEVDVQRPPCITHSVYDIIDKLREIIK